MRTLKVVLGILLAATGAFAQSQMSAGDLKGTVTDSSGSVISGAKISVTNVDTAVARFTTSDAAGNFRFLVLPPASYELRIQAVDFAIYTRRPLQITVGQTVIADAQLQLASLQEEVVVQLAVPAIEPEKTQQSDTVTRERIENLPINERNFLNFSLLTPGVTSTNTLATFTLPMAQTSGLSFLGQNGRSNSVTIDGVDDNDDAVASVRSTMSQEAVQEFQINRSNFSAEFGRASGGLINIVSKSGTNEWHGNVFSFFRNQALDARNAFAFGAGGTNIDPPYSRQQSGFTIGGPLKKDKTFAFLSYEGLRQRESRFVTFLENYSAFQPTASQTALIAGLSALPSVQLRTIAATLNAALTTTSQLYPDTVRLLQSNSGVFPYRNNDNTASLRLDHTLSPSSQLFGRLTFTDVDTIGGSFGGLNGPSHGTNYQIQDVAAVIGETHFINSRLVNESRFQFASREYNAFPGDPYGPEININGVASLGRNYFLPSLRTERRYQLVDNFTAVRGRHEFKFGGDFSYIPIDTNTQVFLGGRFIFGEQVPLGLVIDNIAGAGTSASMGASLAAAGRTDLIPNISQPVSALQSYNFGLPIAYQQGFGDPHANLTNKVFAGYMQDNFKASSKLTLNAGLRYDMEFQPSPIHRDRNNFGPRIGFSYSPDSKTAFRGGYGIYYAPLFEAVAFVGRVLNGQQISQVYVPLTGLPQLGIPTTSAQVWGLLHKVACPSSATPSANPCSRTLTAADIALLGLVPGVTPPVLLRPEPGIVNPYSQQFSLGVDREVPGGVNLSMNYLGNRGTKLLRSRNDNLQQVGVNAYGPTFAPINPRILQDNLVESSGNSIYHGLAVTATKRYSSKSQFQLSYTLSKAIDDTTDFITDLQAANQLNLRGERSLSTFDQRQRLVVSGLLESPFERGVGVGKVLADVSLSPIVTYSSGQPFNLLLGFDANNDTQANTDRPVGAGRNTGQGPNFASVDFRVAKKVSFGTDARYGFEGILEAFNLFNRVNYSGVNNIVGNMSFTAYRVHGRSDLGPTNPLGFTSAFDPRQIQVALKFHF